LPEFIGSHGPDREQREQADQEPGQRRPTEELVPGAETTQAPLDAVVDRDPAPVRQIVSQLIGSSEVTRSTGRDVVVGPAATIPWAILPGRRVTIWRPCRRPLDSGTPRAPGLGTPV